MKQQGRLDQHGGVCTHPAAAPEEQGGLLEDEETFELPWVEAADDL